MKRNEIDFVITWLDDSDPAWRKKRTQYSGGQLDDVNCDARFRDWGTLRYWFRGVEKFAPWVRHVYFVTDDHKPDWLDVNHPKLKWVKHTDYIPEEYLPTFNSVVIEWNFHRIEGLAENFVYFNDDMFLINDTVPTDFFVDGVPCYYPVLEYVCPTSPYSYICFNDAYLINRNFNCRASVKKFFRKWMKQHYFRDVIKNLFFGRKSFVVGMKVPHIHYNHKKETFKELWEKEYENVHETCMHKFRSINDISDDCVRMWQIMSGNFYPQKPIGKCFPTDSLQKKHKALDYIRKQKGKVVCINDNENEVDFELHKQMLIDAFEEILPEKSSFELY